MRTAFCHCEHSSPWRCVLIQLGPYALPHAWVHECECFCHDPEHL